MPNIICETNLNCSLERFFEIFSQNFKILLFKLWLGSGDSNPHWFHIAIFPVTAVNPLKIRQYSLRNLLCYRKNCLCETASTCSAEFLQRISVRKGADGLTPVKTDKAEGFVKIQSTGNAGSSPHCLGGEPPNTVYAPFKQQKSTGRNDASLLHKYFSVYI